MENNNNDLDGQGLLFNKENYLRPAEDSIDKKLHDQDIEFLDEFCNTLDEMDRKADTALFGNKPL